jgi:hypothetical protein
MNFHICEFIRQIVTNDIVLSSIPLTSSSKTAQGGSTILCLRSPGAQSETGWAQRPTEAGPQSESNIHSSDRFTPGHLAFYFRDTGISVGARRADEKRRARHNHYFHYFPMRAPTMEHAGGRRS